MRLPQLSGQETIVWLHMVRRCCSVSLRTTTLPHWQFTGHRSHSCSWPGSSRLGKRAPHLLHATSLAGQRVVCSLASLRGNAVSQRRQVPSMVPSRAATILLGTRFWMSTRHKEHLASWPLFLKIAKQDPQKVCPHGTRIFALRIGFVL